MLAMNNTPTSASGAVSGTGIAATGAFSGTGIAASAGVCFGRALVLTEPEGVTTPKERHIGIDQVEAELARMDAALLDAAEGLEAVRRRTAQTVGEAEAQVFEAQKMMLQDPMLLDLARSRIRSDLYAAETALFLAVETVRAMFLGIDDEYLRARADDVGHIGRAVLMSLAGVRSRDLANLSEEVILVARDLSPADTVTMNRRMVKGFLTVRGGTTSHTAIIARTLELPAVVGCGEDVLALRDGMQIALDGTTGEWVADPSPETVRDFQDRLARFLHRQEGLGRLAGLTATTRDGTRIELAGNIALPDEAALVLDKGGDGVGLFRTEFLYLDRNRLPDEDEQAEAYGKAAKLLGDKPCIIRTMDIGGDKPLPILNLPKEDNPFLGYRAIRISLREPELFKTQLRAILRASIHGNLRMMFPMISGLPELRAAKRLLEEAKQELRARSVPFREDLPVGIMIEIPSAAVMADLLAKECDFFSIGTNDLCQYTLAVDRMNDRIGDLYDPWNPGVLRLIRNVISAGHAAGIPVGMCGEMASDPDLAALLLGLGLDEFSMSPAAIPTIKEIIRNTPMKGARRLAEDVFKAGSGEEMRAIAANWRMEKEETT